MADRPRAHPADVRSSLLQAAARLTAARGFDAVSVQDIAAEVGVTKQALLYHFKSKDALRLALIDDVLGRANYRFMTMLGGLRAERRSRVEAILEHTVEYLEEQADGAAIILRFLLDRDRAAIERIISSVRPWFRLLESELVRAKAAKQVRADLDAEAAVIQIAMLVVTNFALLPIEHWDRRAPKAWKRQRLEALAHSVEHILFPDARR